MIILTYGNKTTRNVVNKLLQEIRILRDRAEQARLMYKRNMISREEAKEKVMPYINAHNEASKRIAKKYGRKPKEINFASYIR